MKVQGIYKGRTYKEVTIETDVEASSIDQQILIGYAMCAAGESPSSLFGWGVSFPSLYSRLAVVTLDTD